MNDKIRVAVVGAGNIARAHLNAYVQSGRAEIVAVADVVEEMCSQDGSALGRIILRRYGALARRMVWTNQRVIS